jgi:hypothetical protein
LRVNTPLSPELLEKINDEFQGFILKGKIKSTEPLKEELRNHEHPTLP